jgi:hypothetical protein
MLNPETTMGTELSEKLFVSGEASPDEASLAGNGLGRSRLGRIRLALARSDNEVLAH